MLLHFKTEIDFNNMYSNCNPGGLGSQKLWNFLIGLIPKGKLKRAHHKYRIIYIMLKKIYLYYSNLSFYMYFSNMFTKSYSSLCRLFIKKLNERNAIYISTREIGF